MNVVNGILYKALTVDGYWYNEDKGGWYGEFEYDVMIISYSFYMNEIK